MQRVKVQLGVFWKHLILLLLVEACFNFESCLQQFIHNFLMLLGCLIIEVQQISFSFILSFSLKQLESMEGRSASNVDFGFDRGLIVFSVKLSCLWGFCSVFMAIGEKECRVSKSGGDFSSLSRDSMLIDDDQRESSLFESSVDEGSDEEDEEYSDDDEEEDVASGAGSDDCDLLDLGEVGGELCQVGNSSCSLTFELYDLPDLTGVLSLETWNDCLTEEERFSLAEYLPDVDQATFMRTLKELFAGDNFHFGSPLTQLFSMLKGGLCEPGVALYCQGLKLFERHRHYRLLCKYQNSMVSDIIQIKDAWENCAAYSIEEKLRLLNILRSQKSLMYEEGDMLGSETDSSAREETINSLWTKMGMDGSRGAKSSGLAVYTRRPSLEVSSQGRAMALKPAKYRKQNPKGILDVSAPKASSKKDHTAVMGHIPSLRHGLEMKARPSVLSSSLHWRDQVVGYDSGTVRGSQVHMMAGDHGGKQAYGVDIQKRWSMGDGVTVAKVNPLKSGKRGELDLHIGLGEEVTESYISMPFPLTDENFPNAKKKNAKTMEMRVEPVNDRYHEYGKKVKYPKKLHQKTSVEERLQYATERGQDLFSKGIQVDWSASCQPFRHCKTQEEAPSIDHQDIFYDWNLRNKKLKISEEFKTGNRSAGLDSKIKTYRTSSPQMHEPYFMSDHRARTSKKIRKYYAQNGGFKMGCQRDSDIFTQSDETESDSSEQVYKDADIIHSTSRLVYPGDIVAGGLSASVRSGDKPKKVSKITRKVKIDYAQFTDEVLPTSVNVGGVGEQSHMPEIEIFSSEGKKRGKMNEPSCLRGDQKQNYNSMNNQMQGDTNASSERKLEGKFDVKSSECGSNYMHMCARHLEVGDRAHSNVLSGMTDTNFHERSAMALLRCNSVTLKQKRKGDVKYMDGLDEPNVPRSGSLHPNDEPDFSKKWLKGKVDDELIYSPMKISNSLISGRGRADLEPETKPLKRPFTLITPSIHTGFSFSIIHLLTAVRMAMATVHAEDASEVGNHLEKIAGRMNLKDGHDGKLEGGAGLLSHENMHMNHSEHIGQKIVPSLTVREIVDRVRSNPRDPCILETQEPLHDLVRGVLKIFSSKTAPLGAKGWKALVSYEKSTKSWSWIGSISSSLAHETGEEETSAEAWGVPHKMLVKLVDSFANWLKNGQETLNLIGSLPPPPVPVPNMDEERFRDLRAQKSLITINPSTDEVKAYFRKEEFLRYSIPDRAFSFTAADGRKSTVAPLRRCGGKPTSKARDHFILKPDRPPHVTILCLVRDAAARLPGSIGTRADVCTLLRDSQYIVEVVSDAQVNQVVSGALDRLHYELDPCVQFDAERKLWVYLHRDREEEDFEDDGTSSTKKWKRPRKEHPNLSVIGGEDDVVHQGTED
ncbi:hypothetical protein MRB53_024772 [Persea americana]|uniref:Uncharacterized protein n=1 Tax=Persea americana TaxID=3435 RepID=A0ACC2LDA9_PERAE|nr:hypothetical protein MRB53_024772 [Persea americana]